MAFSFIQVLICTLCKHNMLLNILLIRFQAVSVNIKLGTKQKGKSNLIKKAMVV